MSACAASTSSQDSLRDKAKELLESDPKAQEVIDRIEKAASKVDAVREKQRQLEVRLLEQAEERDAVQLRGKQEERDAVTRRAQLAADAQRAKVEMQQLERQLLNSSTQRLQSELQQVNERIESVKAATLAAAGGLAGLLPTALTSTLTPIEQIGDVLTSIVTCFLFGVVYRYIIAADRENPQLKGGAIGAFGLTRGLAVAKDALVATSSWDKEVLASAALLLGQNMLIVAFAAGAVELGLRYDYVKYFGEPEDDL